MEIKTFVFNPFYENTIVVSSEKKNAFIIDPGCYESYEVDEVLDYVRYKELSIAGIINTHCHIDHVLGNNSLKFKFKTTLQIPKNEQEMFEAVVLFAPQWGINGYQPADVDAYLQEGQELELDEISFQVIEVPGHSPGHVVFYEKRQKKLFGGDVLFRESIGRTDLPGGNHADLIQNIQQKVYTLPDDVEVFPGHGPTTTIGYEKLNNPFVKG